MSEPVLVGDLVTAVSDALHGDRTRLGAMVAGARQRAEERALDALMPRAREPEPVDPMPAPVERAIRRLVQADEELAQKVAALQEQADQALIRLVDVFGALQRQVRDVAALPRPVAATTVPASARVAGRTGEARPVRQPPSSKRLQRREQLRQVREARLLAGRVQMQNVTNVVNSVQAAAYGQRGSILATNNLLLAATQLFWSLLDPVLQGAGVLNAASATALAALAPIGTLLSGHILLGERQHVRFISGVTTLDNSGVARESLRGLVAEGLWPTFRQRTDVPVTATLVNQPGGGGTTVIANVDQGILQLRVPVPLYLVKPVRVAWTVDTGADVG